MIDSQAGRGPAALPCGRSREPLLDQVADGRGDARDAHQRGCAHCAEALEEYARLWSPLRELAAEDVPPPSGGLVDDVLTGIRHSVDDTGYAVVDSGVGVTRVAGRVLAAAARESAQGVPGVRAALSKHVGIRDGAGTGAGAVDGDGPSIEITLAADYGSRLDDLVERVRDAVTSRVRYLTDLDPVDVVVIVDDVLA